MFKQIQIRQQIKYWLNAPFSKEHYNKAKLFFYFILKNIYISIWYLKCLYANLQM